MLWGKTLVPDRACQEISYKLEVFRFNLKLMHISGEIPAPVYTPEANASAYKGRSSFISLPFYLETILTFLLNKLPLLGWVSQL